ncbi:hypothetical protein [Natronorubrum sp. A-ect3]|uniref:hypothetical protein n=1 Tax=Natronorubrum sp. A-ect3 TaxID=3242698 RepID=UPI00359D1798
MSETCSICGDVFENQHGLSVHRSTAHPGHEDLQTCFQCGYRYGGTQDRWECPQCAWTNRPVIRAAIEADTLYYASGHGPIYHVLPPDPAVSLCGQITVRQNLDGRPNENTATRFRGYSDHDKPEEYWCSSCQRIYRVLEQAGAFTDGSGAEVVEA